jgi:hypothetical protein
MDTRTPSATHLTDTQRIDRLRLIRSDNVGPRGVMAQTPQGAESGPPGGLGSAMWRRCWFLYYAKREPRVCDL